MGAEEVKHPFSTWMFGFGVEVLEGPDDAVFIGPDFPLHFWSVYLVFLCSAYPDINLSLSSVQMGSKFVEMDY